MADGMLYLLSTQKGRTINQAKLANSWKRRYFVLHEEGRLLYFRSGKNGVGNHPKGGIMLNADFFVADSLLRRHGFQISDFETTFYLGAESAAEMLTWMFKVGTLRAPPV